MEKDIHEKKFILQYIQPGLLGLMDGSVSTLAPLFAAVFATRSSHIALLIGLSAAIGAAISMAFAGALSDTGVHTGRGHPIRRGFVTGAMTFLGGILHNPAVCATKPQSSPLYSLCGGYGGTYFHCLHSPPLF